MTGVLVRPCTEGDLPGLERVMPSGGLGVHAELLAMSRAGRSAYLVAVEGDAPVGAGLVRWESRLPAELSERHRGAPEISNLGVWPARQGHGIGTAIVGTAEGLIRERGHSAAVIAVADGNDRAALLYRRLGYVDTGVTADDRYLMADGAGGTVAIVERVRYLVRALGAPP